MLVTGAPHTPLAGAGRATATATGTGANASARTALSNGATNANANAPVPLNRSASAVRLRPLSPLHSAARQQQLQQQQQQQRPLSPPPGGAPSSPTHARAQSQSQSLSQRSLASAAGSVCASCGAAVATAAAASASAAEEPSRPSLLESASAPGSLDAYLALSTQQSSQGLELVYGLKIELSKMVEELSDRYPEGTDGVGGGVARLPYRVVGRGGMLWWQEVREGKRRPPDAEAEAHTNEGRTGPGAAADAGRQTEPGALPPSDPFGTFLPSLQAPPPPLTPSSVLPAMVLLNMLRTGVRTVLARGEDQVDELRERLAESEAARASLAAQLDQALARPQPPSTAASTPTAAAAAAAAAAGASPPGSPGQRSRKKKMVQFSEEHQGPFGSTPPAAAATAASPAATAPDGGGESWPASPPFSPSLSGSNSNGATPPDALSLSQTLSQLPSSGNWTREDALSRALGLSETSSARWKARARAASDALAAARQSHQDELGALKAALHAREAQLSEQSRALTQRAVLLQLESISRRERADKTVQMHRYYADQIRAWEAEVKELLNPRRERLFVRKGDQSLPPAAAGTGTGFVTALGTGGGRTPALTAGRSAKRRGGGTTPALMSPPPEAAGSAPDESKEGDPEQRLVITASMDAGGAGAAGASTPSKPSGSASAGADPGSTLYPSPSSPLVLLQQSMKTPAGRQWLGKMLSPPAATSAGAGAVVERDALFVVAEKRSSAPGEGGNNNNHSSGGGGGGAGTTQGHLVPGADILAVDLLLVVDELFRREYASLSRESVELARSARFGAELDRRRRGIREGTLSRAGAGADGTDAAGADDTAGAGSGAGVESGEVGPDGCPTPAALAALISSIPGASLSYLQALQRLFLSLYARLPASVQARFAKLQSAARKVDILNQRFRDAMLSAQTQTGAGTGAAAVEKKDAPTSSAGAAATSQQQQQQQQTEPSAWAQHQLQAVMDDLRGVDVHARSTGSGSGLGPTSASASAPMQVPSFPPAGAGPSKADAAGSQLLIPARAVTLQADSFAPLSSAQSRQSHPHSSSAALSAAMRLALPGGAAAASSAIHSGAATPSAASEAGPAVVDRDSSAYLARLELILHKVRALANFRDVVLNM